MKISLAHRVFRALVATLFPHRCRVCSKLLSSGERVLCTLCRINLPATGYIYSPKENDLMYLFNGRADIEAAVSLFYYDKLSPYSTIIKNLKFKGAKDIEQVVVAWYCRLLNEANLFNDVDVVIPIPLHPKRLKERGYNQATYIARPIAKALSAKLDESSVVRSRNSQPQSQIKNLSQRITNVDGIFTLVDASALEGKHILLVDDVITTGHTIISLAQTIKEGTSDCRISICALSSVKKYIFR